MTTDIANPYAALEESPAAALEQRAPKKDKKAARKEKKEEAVKDAAPAAAEPAAKTDDAAEKPAEPVEGWTVKETKRQERPKTAKKEGDKKATGSFSKFGRELEEKAASKEKEARDETISSWIASLKDGSTTTRDDRTGAELTFRQALLKSRALEVLAENVAQAWQDAPEDQLNELFDLTLDGSKEEHKKIVSHLKKLSNSFQGKRAPALMNKIVSAIVEGAKSQADADVETGENAVEKELKKIDQQISKLQAKVSAEPQDATESGGVQLEILRLFDSKRRLLVGGPDSLRSADDVEHTFNNFNHEVGQELDRVQHLKVETSKKRELVINERKQIENRGDQEYKDAKTKREDVDKEEQKLRARKTELERELEEVKGKLNGIGRRRDDADRVVKEAELNRTKRMATLTDRESVLKSDATKLDEDHKSLAAIRDFVQDAHTVMTKLRGNKAADQGAQVDSVCREHLKAIAGYLNTQVKAMELLKQRIDFCQRSIDRMLSEKKEMSSSGLVDIAQDITRGIDKLKKTQTDTVQQLRSSKKVVDKAVEGLNHDADKKHPEYKTVTQLIKKIEDMCP
eukprot:TRINITY_DN11675_c0_g1::TRINITY_DN11675_c0_g1_i1::g.17501::m.17501 TRINITY_DN11675_c0_g1::TRINITY_DN11675_c0_g1_i1::g.17501  ORF type:complete len:572 (+),score=282.26,PMC2NT/PF08066.7/1.6e+03,PMC2NT/PF08066.7/4.3e+03,PMC2NT/PF08066.7/0.55,Baculo_PEP_C/PF04513.7/5.3,Baculo_PEP_C/PF04513.7/5.1e+03,Baculo_PEP_C/PF04513.7/5.7e+02,Baculo_PEP_C/PF04513.7/55 TRINITY_DN11675_c0_g1_i1:79-1794(+)